MERNPWNGPSVMTWGIIGINQGVGPVIFQNLVPSRENGVMTHRYIDQVFTSPNRLIVRRHGNTILQQNSANSTPCHINAEPSSTLMEDIPGVPK